MNDKKRGSGKSQDQSMHKQQQQQSDTRQDSKSMPDHGRSKQQHSGGSGHGQQGGRGSDDR